MTKRDGMDGYHGHMTLADGSHVALSQEQAKALWDAAVAAKADRERRMPTEQDALRAMLDAHARLKELGWRDAMYCPKDGSTFLAIEAGSTGIFECTYTGRWPDGTFNVFDGGDIWPSHPILFRLKPGEQAKYDARMARMREALANAEKR